MKQPHQEHELNQRWNTDKHRAAEPQPNSSPSRFLRVLRAFAVKVQRRIHREAAKSAKIARRKILSCQKIVAPASRRLISPCTASLAAGSRRYDFFTASHIPRAGRPCHDLMQIWPICEL